MGPLHRYQPTLLASCAGDHTVKLWDTHQPGSTATIPAHDFEACPTQAQCAGVDYRQAAFSFGLVPSLGQDVKLGRNS